MKRICKYMIMGAVALSVTACNDSFWIVLLRMT